MKFDRKKNPKKNEIVKKKKTHLKFDPKQNK